MPTIYRGYPNDPAKGWLVSNWGAGQSTITAWSPDHVRVTQDGIVEVVLDNAPAGSSDPYFGAELQSSTSARPGTWSWTPKAPEMVDGAVFGLVAYMADHAN